MLLACFLLAPIPAAAVQREAQLSLTSDSDARWVPFTLSAANQIRFTALIDGRPVEAILDTGVSHSVVARRFADASGLRIQPGPQAEAIGGSASIGWVDSPALSFGGLTRRFGRLAVVVLPKSATGGQAADLLVGRDLLAAFGLEIDYDSARFRLLPSGRLPFHGTDLPLTITGGAPAYVSDTPIDGRPARLIVDTGDGNAVTLSTEAWRRLGSDAVVTSTLSYGVGGSAETGLAVLPSLDLGPLHSGRVEVAIEGNGGFSQSIGASGRIGTGFLRRYHVLLDPGAGHMVLAPGARADLAPLKSTSGLLVVRDGDVLRVLHVMRASPAMADGWRAGDSICSVDGVAVASTPKDQPAGWPIGAPGRVVRLGLCGGSTRALTLRDFY